MPLETVKTERATTVPRTIRQRSLGSGQGMERDRREPTTVAGSLILRGVCSPTQARRNSDAPAGHAFPGSVAISYSPYRDSLVIG